MLSAFDTRFPIRLRERLGGACPPFLLVAGAIEWLGREAIGVVGSRDAEPATLDLAPEAAGLAGEHGRPVVSGLARGVVQPAMTAAYARGGAVGVPIEGIGRAARTAELRRRVRAGELALVSPDARHAVRHRQRDGAEPDRRRAVDRDPGRCRRARPRRHVDRSEGSTRPPVRRRRRLDR